MSRIRLRPTRGSVLMVVLAGAFFIASRTAGAGWLTVMVALLIGIVVWSSFDSWLAVRKMEIEMVGPTDAMVGRPFAFEFTGSAPRAGATIAVYGNSGPGQPVWFEGSVNGHLKTIPARRGVMEWAPFQVVSHGTLGLIKATLSGGLPLPRPIDVAPVPTPVSLPLAATLAGAGETAVGGRHSDGETVRSVREYQPGDPMRMINWAVTARRDELAVKELEAPQSPTLVVELDLNGDPDIAERHASLAAGYVQVGLRSGLPVVLYTHDAAGPHRGGVGSMLEAGRRLARATPGPLPLREAEGWASVIRLGPRSS